MPEEDLTYLCRDCFWATRRDSRSIARRSPWQPPARLFAVLLTSAAVVWIAGRAARLGFEPRSSRQGTACVPPV